ncbi:heme o synthase [Phaeocystidibacter luteus]|uniref:Protoheme IX farnesyltransferase n=1 Tax=Phaeocystidibacter luteus TaxID=911197 RepID=A0A6N6RHC6_9FLAO|nr:heme o synthase [Phaeocystidibacter luteus]KAB2813766.1 protoheme IX farnesyltransferase [Phaeocystidibacter luteus]
MKESSTTYLGGSRTLQARLSDYTQLLKFRLTSSVVFSASAGYLLATDSFNWSVFVALVLGGFLTVGASNAFNQIWERNRDALMNRTKNRPLAAGRMSVTEGLIVSTLALIAGAVLLFRINPMSAYFGLLSVGLYTLVYTPMKARTPWAVFVGAFPGAIPFMLGWVAATNDFDIEPGLLFAVQFFWQFPHFWAIGWVAYEDYAKAGYYLLPTRKRDQTSANLIITYTIWTIFVSLLPVFSFTGALTLSIPSAIVVFLLGLWLLSKAIKLKRNPGREAARSLMLTSVGYLPLVQIVYVLERYLF